MADDPVLVITGASTGIGAATAHRAVEFGHRVVLGARSEDKLEALAQELGGAPSAGFFAAGEIGPVGGEHFLHSFTATIAVFA